MSSAQRESNRYHHDYYSKHELFESGTWLEKPNATLIDLTKTLVGQTEIRILDLGAGVGRNAIPMAKVLENSIASIECVDIVPLALQKLNENALRHGVVQAITPVLSSVSEYSIAPNKYNLVAAMSVLENAVKLNSFPSQIRKIQLGTKVGGFNCLSIATDLIEKDGATLELLEPLIEASFSSDGCAQVLCELYNGWDIRELEFSRSMESQIRNGQAIQRSANYCIFAANRRV